MRAKIIKTDKWIDVEKFKSGYRDKKTLYTYAPEELELKEVDWDAFRRDAAKDIIPAILSCDKIMEHIWNLTGTGKHPAKTQDMVVNISIKYANELIRQLKEYQE